MKNRILLLLLLIALSSCKTVYVPVETIRTEYKDNYIRDTIHIIDSISQYVMGDTVYKYKTSYIFKDKLVKDSVIIRDSIPYPVPVEVLREVNKLTSWQIVQMWIGRGAVIMGLVILGYIYVKRKIRIS